MNKKNRTALIITILLGAIVFWLVINKRKGTINEELRDFAFRDTAAITKIFLADKAGSTITLDKIKQGEWKLNNKYSVRKDAIDLLLYTIKSIEVREPIGKNAKENIIKRLASQSTKVEIYQGDKLAKVYYVGGETADHTGTYMLLVNPETGENYPAPFIMYIPGFDGYLTTRYFTNEAEWRDRTVFKYIPSQIKSVKVEFLGFPQNSYELSVFGNNKFEIKNLKDNAPIPNFDTIAVKQYLSYFENINYEALITDITKQRKDFIIQHELFGTITITDATGNKNSVRMFHKAAQEDQLEVTGEPMKYDPDRMFALINNDEDFILIQFYTFGKLLQPIDYFLKKGK